MCGRCKPQSTWEVPANWLGVVLENRGALKPVGWANHGAPAFRSDLQGGKTGAPRNGACRSRPPNRFLTSSRFFGLRRHGFCCWLRRQLGFLLRGELVLDLEADCVHVHLVRGGGVAEPCPG